MATWWQEGVIYQIYPRSFKDSNGDGIGDLEGIIGKLGYLKALGIAAIWLSPVYASPNKDNGYDISDYCSIHPEYGTMEAMERLIQVASGLGIRIVMDLVINHTSNAHEWFQKSRQNIAPYSDYYIWKSGENGKKPNNWTSFFAEDCWVYDEVKEQYYLHLFAKEQPDLNYNNPLVIKEIKEIMGFWLDKGIAGFRCDVINVIYKASLADGKKRLILTGIEHYLSREGAHEILQELRRDVLDHYDCFTVGETVFVTPSMGKDLCDPDRKELDMIFSFEHMEADQIFVKWFKRKFSPRKFGQALATWQKALKWNANYFENHDQLRSVSRFGDDHQYYLESAKMLALLLLSLKGTPFIYQGQEIGMTNFDYESMDAIKDVESHNVYALLKKFHVPKSYRWKMIKASSRDNVRTPMQWDATTEGGFTTGKPWIQVNKNYKEINVASQLEDEDTVLSFYKRMIRFRSHSNVLISGEFIPIKISNKVMVFKRFTQNEAYIIGVNFTNKNQKIDLKGDVLLGNYKEQKIDGVLKPYEAVILNNRDNK